MNRHGSRNISAIEDRALERVENTSSIAAQIRDEARESVARRRMAMSTGQVVGSIKGLARSIGSNFAAEAQRVIEKQQASDDVDGLRVSREPCFACGVRQDRHDELGCKRWRGN